VVEARTHNAAHELTAVGSAALTYDARGDLVQDNQSNVLAWDFESHLRTYTPSGQSSVSYLYDVLGRRVGRKKGSTTRVFVHAGPQVVAEYDNTTLAIKYFHGDHIDRPVAYWFNNDHYWYSSNHLGSVGGVTNDVGSVVERYRYDAYGSRTILSPTGSVRSSSTVANQIGYTGRYHDKETGLVHFRYRDYHPRLGRFISRDDDYRDGASLYRAYFVPNRTDPTGHDDGYHTLDDAANAALDNARDLTNADPLHHEYGTSLWYDPKSDTYGYDDNYTQQTSSSIGDNGHSLTMETDIPDGAPPGYINEGSAHSHPWGQASDADDQPGHGSTYVVDAHNDDRWVYEPNKASEEEDQVRRDVEPGPADELVNPFPEDINVRKPVEEDNSTPPCDDEDNDGQCDEPEGSGT
jgi:RHS repeat-associated protein